MKTCRWPGCDQRAGLVDGAQDGVCYYHSKRIGQTPLIDQDPKLPVQSVELSAVVSDEQAEAARVLKHLGYTYRETKTFMRAGWRRRRRVA